MEGLYDKNNLKKFARKHTNRQKYGTIARRTNKSRRVVQS